MADVPYPIQMAARLTGLSTHVIRIWEQRYRAVEPRRSASRRRLFHAADIERLQLLRDLTRAGHRISHLAPVSTRELRRLAGVTGPPAVPAAGRERASTAHDSAVESLDRCLAAIGCLDGPALEGALQQGATSLGVLALLLRVIAPLARQLGDRWRDGSLTAAHEHFATAIIRDFLGAATRPFGSLDQAPRLVVATPTGQVHEMGALLAAAVAAHLGWRVTYLGPSLPAVEIAGAARQVAARVVALSIVYPEDDPTLPGELNRLRELLPPGTDLVVGGRALSGLRDLLPTFHSHAIEDLDQLGNLLDRLRASPRPRSSPPDPSPARARSIRRKAG